MDGQSFSKNPNSTSVINLVPPRELWGPIQKIRTKFVFFFEFFLILKLEKNIL